LAEQHLIDMHFQFLRAKAATAFSAS